MTKARIPSSEELFSLREMLSYDGESGEIIWLKRPALHTPAGARAGTIISQGKRLRRTICIAGQRYMEHRIAWFLKTGEWPERDIDHKDGNPCNNKWENLRLATSTQNHANSCHRGSKYSNYKGVSFDKRRLKWKSTIRCHGKYYFLGHYDSAEAAHSAYVKRAKILFGEFARAS